MCPESEKSLPDDQAPVIKATDPHGIYEQPSAIAKLPVDALIIVRQFSKTNA
jgi:hypothetical protein